MATTRRQFFLGPVAFYSRPDEFDLETQHLFLQRIVTKDGARVAQSEDPRRRVRHLPREVPLA